MPCVVIRKSLYTQFKLLWVEYIPKDMSILTNGQRTTFKIKRDTFDVIEEFIGTLITSIFEWETENDPLTTKVFTEKTGIEVIYHRDDNRVLKLFQMRLWDKIRKCLDVSGTALSYTSSKNYDKKNGKETDDNYIHKKVLINTVDNLVSMKIYDILSKSVRLMGICNKKTLTAEIIRSAISFIYPNGKIVVEHQHNHGGYIDVDEGDFVDPYEVKYGI
jgi:hypothetical protein